MNLTRGKSKINTIPEPLKDDPEEWKNLPDYLKLSKYQASSLGRIRNIETGYIFSVNPTKQGYVRSGLSLDDKTFKKFRLHILVAKTFIPNELNKDTVNHINTKKNDNRVINLEWSTHSEQNYKENKQTYTSRGKSVIQYDLKGNFIKKWDKIIDAANELDIIQTNICCAASGKSKSSGGFIWKYCEEDSQDLEGEIWKKISDEYDAFVSNFGRIKTNGNPHYGTLMEDGYYCSNLFNKIKKKRLKFRIHRLVCQAFLPNPENKPIVNHKDENRSNNKLENLEWMTNQENINHSLDLNDRIKTNSRSRTVLQIQNGIVINEFPSINQAAIQTDFSNTFIRDRCNGRTKQSGDFVWEFKTDVQ